MRQKTVPGKQPAEDVIRDIRRATRRRRTQDVRLLVARRATTTRSTSCGLLVREGLDLDERGCVQHPLGRRLGELGLDLRQIIARAGLQLVRRVLIEALDAGKVTAQALNSAINDIRKGRTADSASAELKRLDEWFANVEVNRIGIAFDEQQADQPVPTPEQVRAREMVEA